MAPELANQPWARELALQLVKHVQATLKESGMTTKLPIPEVACLTTFDADGNPVRFVPRGIKPLVNDDYDKCPVCECNWHGLIGNGTDGAAGCPGELGSDEDKQQWLLTDTPQNRAAVQCIGFLSATAELLGFDRDEGKS